MILRIDFRNKLAWQSEILWREHVIIRKRLLITVLRILFEKQEFSIKRVSLVIVCAIEHEFRGRRR